MVLLREVKIITNPDQKLGVDFASLALKLLKEKELFDNAMKAVMQEEEEDFADACEACGIPNSVPGVGTKIHETLYKMLRAGLTDYDMLAWP